MRIPFPNRPLSWQVALGAAALAVCLSVVRGDTRPNSRPTDVKRLPSGAAQLYRETTLFPQPMKYQEIPWLLDLEQGIRLAQMEKRPLLIWTSGDDPLERC
jgi:hypothetical protein